MPVVLSDTKPPVKGQEPGGSVATSSIPTAARPSLPSAPPRGESDRLRRYLDVAGVILVAIRPDQSVELINRRGCEVLGYEEHEIVGRNWFDHFVPPEDRAATKTAFSQLMTGELDTVEHHENHVLTKSGERRLIAWHNSFLRDEQGNITATLSSGEDITEHKGAEERYRLLAENASDLVCLHEPDGRYTYVSPSVTQLLGYNPDELLGVDPYRFFHPGDVDRIREESHQRVLAGEYPITIRYRFRTRTGEYRWLESQTMPIMDDSGVVTGLRSASRDVTEQQQATQTLEREREFLAAVLESIEDGIVACNADGVLTFFNRATREFHGLPEEDIAAEDWAEHYDLFHPDGRTRMRMEDVPLFRALSGETVRDQLMVITPKQREQRTLLASGRAITNAQGELLGAVAAMHDITDRVQAEARLRDYNAQLERSNRELQEFAYVASHDLQEPLRMVSSYLQVLERRYQDKLDEQANEFIGYAVEGAQRMKQLINDLLEYSRVGSRGAPFTPTDTSKVLAGALKNLKVSVEESGATVEHDPLPTVMGDETQLLQLFQNLIGNAIKFRGEAAPRIHVTAVEMESEWRFSVKDNGIGIEAEYAERIFTIFQRLHTRRKYSGTGIGLAVCRRIIERHGGSIWVESDGSTGSVFHFTLAKEGAQHGTNSGGEHDRHSPGRG